MLALAGLILILQLLGLVGLLYALPVALAAIAVGLAVRFVPRLGSRLAEHGGRPAPAPGLVRHWWPPLAPPWCWPNGAPAAAGVDHGMTGADTVWYHLPQAAGFVQDGSITHVQFFETGAGTAFYPATSGLFHALGMLWFGNDFLSPFLNFGLARAALLAAWCLGRPTACGAAQRARGLPGARHADHGRDPAGRRVQRRGGPRAAAGCRRAAGERARARAPPARWPRWPPPPALGTKLSMAVPLAALAIGAVAIARPGRRGCARPASGWERSLAGRRLVRAQPHRVR